MTSETKKWRIYFRLYLLGAAAIGCFALAVKMFFVPRISGPVLFNAGVDVMGLFICTALYYGCIGERKNDLEESTYWLLGLIVQIALCFVNNILSWYIGGVPEYRKVYLFLNELTVIFDFALVMLFYNYVRRMLEFKGRLAKWLDKAVFVLIIPFTLFVLANSFYPIHFLVDEQGVFHPTALYHLVDLYMVIVAPLTILLLIRCEATLRQKLVALSFIAIPIVHYILINGAHGYATQYGSTLFAVTMIYSILFSDRSRKLASTQAELDTARKIQESMLPNIFPAFPERNEFDIYASMDPAREVGGDFYDFFMIDEDHLGIVMADVSGKGVPGAMFMMISKIILQSSAMLLSNPAEILSRTNQAICSNNKEEMFVTVWLGILEISTGLIRAANAGHEYPILMKNKGSYELIKDRHGLVIGAMEESRYSGYEIQMHPGDRLFLYTDGIPEATNRFRKQYGMDNLVKALNEVKEADPEETLAHVRRSVDDFVKDAEQFDDLTMLCLKYNGRE